MLSELQELVDMHVPPEQLQEVDGQGFTLVFSIISTIDGTPWQEEPFHACMTVFVADTTPSSEIVVTSIVSYK